jgi:aryl-alcohol dehydrogenase-like predicted oxidoreductase
MKLALGTVQFGCDYGISNLQGQVCPQEISNILDLATEVGITTLDTASAYGESEKALGQSKLAQQFNIVSKIPALKEKESKQKIDEYLNNSLIQLNVEQLDAVLFHHVNNLINSTMASERFNALTEQKKLGKTKRIGISVYNPEQLEYCCQHFKIDIVQLPLNALDQRFIQSNWLNKLTDKSIEIHARSAFLQGLLLMKNDQLDPYFNPYLKQLKKFSECAQYFNISPLALALAIGCQQPAVTKIVVGCCNVKQLQQIIDAYYSVIDFNEDLSFLACSDKKLLLPNYWQLDNRQPL